MDLVLIRGRGVKNFENLADVLCARFQMRLTNRALRRCRFSLASRSAAEAAKEEGRKMGKSVTQQCVFYRLHKFTLPYEFTHFQYIYLSKDILLEDETGDEEKRVERPDEEQDQHHGPGRHILDLQSEKLNKFMIWIWVHLQGDPGGVTPVFSRLRFRELL